MPYRTDKGSTSMPTFTSGVNADQFPFVHRGTGERSQSKYNGWIEYSPRGNDNPVLVAFRAHLATFAPDCVSVQQLATEWTEHFTHYWRGTRNDAIALVGHRMHARKVLARLAEYDYIDTKEN